MSADRRVYIVTGPEWDPDSGDPKPSTTTTLVDVDADMVERLAAVQVDPDSINRDLVARGATPEADEWIGSWFDPIDNLWRYLTGVEA